MLGLILCCVGAVFNVLTDASRKKVLDHQFDAALISLWCKLVAFACYLALAAVLIARGIRMQMPAIGGTLGIPPAIAFLLYLLLNALLEGTAILLNYRALQVAPLSLCVPFLALTPLFLLPIGSIFLHEAITVGMVIGVLMVVIGSLVINRQLVANGWLEPLKNIFRERGSRYMLIVAFLLACTSALDKWFVNSSSDTLFASRFSRSLTLSMGKCVMLSIFFTSLVVVRSSGRRPWRESAAAAGSAAGIDWARVWRVVPAWLLAAGLFEAVVMVLQLTALQFTVAAIVISIKRSGILLACALGWFLFNERGIVDRVIGSFVMMSGVLIFFLTKPDGAGHTTISGAGAMGVAAIALLGMCVALYLTRDFHKTTAPAELISEVELET